jgi:hypothetical protein
VPEDKFATYANVPAGLIATSVGMFPTGIVVVTVSA